MPLQAQADQDLVFLVAGGNPPARCDQDLTFIIAQRLVPATITTLADQELVFAIAQRVVPLVELVGGGYQDFLGHPLASGYLNMRMNPDLEVYTNGDEVIEGGISFTIRLDASGNCVAGQFVYANSVLLPTGSAYTIQAFAADGTTASSQQTLTIPSTGATFNLSSFVPSSPAF
jgi:hypothetical protein